MDSILCEVHENGLAEVTLNQPKSINSLTYEMLEPLEEKLVAWDADPAISLVVLKGAGEKGFCAGGDMKMLYEAGQQGEARDKGTLFFTLEYKVDQMVSEFSKPIVACLDGIVMGGGVGLGYGASDRIVTERTKWAMPEMNIGFFPDVGAAYFLNQAPGRLGRYLALTATVINGGEAITIGAADHFMKSDDLKRFLEKVKTMTWQTASVKETLQQLIAAYTSEPMQSEVLKEIQLEVDEHFQYESVEDIVASLEKSGSEFALKTAETLRSKSPVSLKVTLKHLIEAEVKTLADCLVVDLVLAKQFMNNPDFFEGVRSVLVDKDHTPDYQYKRLSDVSETLVNQFFQ